MSASRAVTFRNRSGRQLYGIVYEPETRRSDTAVVLLSPGVKSRVAPHRLYWKLARQLTRSGYPVLRFDFWGLGDSEGTLTEEAMPDLYRAIQLGRYVDDTTDAIGWLRRELPVRNIVVAGLCGGGITGLLAASAHADIAGVLAIGIPVTLDGTAVDKVAEMSAGQLRGIRTKYLRKITDPASWRRLLTLKTDLRLLARAFGLEGRRTERPPTAGLTSVLGSNGNPLFSDALAATLRRRVPVLFVFSGADRLYWEYREKFAEPNAAFLEQFRDHLDVRVIDQANHVLTFAEWQNTLRECGDAWLDRWFPRAPANEGRA